MARRKTTTRRKTATTTRRRRSTTARPVARRRRSTRKKGLLSEMFSPAMATGGAKVLISGALGGVGATFLNKLLPASTTPEMKAVYGLGAGFATATLLKMPNVASGMAGVAVAELFKTKGLLSEGYNYADNLNSLPMVLNEGEAMYLSEDMYLAEDYGYNVGYYPAGFGG
jgi:hypothetical protein